jgi:hypothetical protein
MNISKTKLSHYLQLGSITIEAPVCYDESIPPQFSGDSITMRTLLLAWVLLPLTLAWSQAEPAAPTSSTDSQKPALDTKKNEDDKQPLPETARTLPQDAAVLTITGLCPGNQPQSKAAACQTVVTRAQFEELTNAIRPNMPGTTKRQLAASYPRLLAMAREAEQRGLDKTPHYQQMMAFARLQILAQDLVHEIQDDAAQVSDKEVQDYYQQNVASFERVNLQRVMVPDIRQNRPQPNAAAPAQSDAESDRAAMAHEADSLRARAAAGEDFGKLQKEAYAFAGLTTPPPSITLEKMRRSSLPATQISVFDLKAGEVSPVFAEAGGFYIYKIVSKDVEPLSEAQNEIGKTLVAEHTHAMMQKVQDSITTEQNPAYFGPPAAKRRSSSQATPKSPANTAQNSASQENATTENPK